MIRAFLQINCRFQVYTTQDTTGIIRAFLQVNFLKLTNYSHGYKQTVYLPLQSLLTTTIGQHIIFFLDTRMLLLLARSQTPSPPSCT